MLRHYLVTRFETLNALSKFQMLYTLDSLSVPVVLPFLSSSPAFLFPPSLSFYLSISFSKSTRCTDLNALNGAASAVDNLLVSHAKASPISRRARAKYRRTLIEAVSYFKSLGLLDVRTLLSNLSK